MNRRLIEEIRMMQQSPQDNVVTAIVRAQQMLRKGATVAVPFMQCNDAPNAKAEERWDRVMGRMLGQLMASTVLGRTKPGADPRLTLIFQVMQEEFVESLEAHKNGRHVMPYDHEHERMIRLMDAFSPGGNLEEGLDEAFKMLREMGVRM